MKVEIQKVNWISGLSYENHYEKEMSHLPPKVKKVLTLAKDALDCPMRRLTAVDSHVTMWLYELMVSALLDDDIENCEDYQTIKFWVNTKPESRERMTRLLREQAERNVAAWDTMMSMKPMKRRRT
jgi:hypothetical protein